MRRPGRIEAVGLVFGVLAAVVAAAALARALLTPDAAVRSSGALAVEGVALAALAIGAGAALGGTGLGLVLPLGRPRERAVLIAAGGAALWTVAALGSLLAGAVASGRALDAADAGTALLDYAGGAGVARATLAVGGAVLATLLFGIRGRVTLLVPALIALAALVLGATLVPVARTGASASPAEVLTGRPLPPPLEPARWISSWSVDPLWFAVVAIGIVAVISTAARARRVGSRDVVAGAALLLLHWVTSGAPHVYGPSLIVAHTVGAVLLATLVPAMLVLGAPLRFVARRDPGPGGWGAAEWSAWARGSRAGRALGRPIVAGALFAVVAWGLIAGPALRWAVTDATGRVVSPVLLLVAGGLLVRALAEGSRGERVAALVLALAAIAGAVASLLVPGLVLANWYGALPRPGADPTAGQHASAVVAGVLGAVGVVAMAGAAAGRADLRRGAASASARN